jgi:Protein of unknown function (DUF2865)
MKRLFLRVLAAACLPGAGLVGLALPWAERSASPAPVVPVAATRVGRVGELVTTADWFDQIFSGPQGDDGARGPPRRFRPVLGEDEDGRRREGGYFRTMCVRLCDGFPIPLSFSTTRSRFAKDARRCAEACPAGRLFVYRNPGEEMEEMVDLDGRHYRQLPNAFQYQSSFVENCTCHGNPWDGQAIARHQAYADEAAQLAAAAAERKPKASQRSDARGQQRRRWVESHIGDTERR